MEMPKESVASAVRSKVARRSDFERGNVDTTVQEKNVRFPTDARTLDRARARRRREGAGHPLQAHLRAQGQDDAAQALGVCEGRLRDCLADELGARCDGAPGKPLRRQHAHGGPGPGRDGLRLQAEACILRPRLSRARLQGRGRRPGRQPVPHAQAPRAVEVVEEEKRDRARHRACQERPRDGQEHARRGDGRQDQRHACGHRLQPGETHEGPQASLFVPAHGGLRIRGIPVGIPSLLPMRRMPARAPVCLNVGLRKQGLT